ncbi:replication-relaxation family protein [Bradyrhizobium sp. 153]|uniref:replication-relaxation family protein n=1 Tax=Bradyrhizobium sp. 153 TaxID=2782627 RepID=UPI001FF95616|nr:replication-relaxation family protein [Bradyrhizobium sp. 153]MCK1665562.1 replication-relaxation family protein [Bradyrhizobium sp. 153]
MSEDGDSSLFLARTPIARPHNARSGTFENMDDATPSAPKRRTRFRRSSEPVPFRITDGDALILRQLARYRFLRSTHIAALVGRSLDRTNDRLCRLYHAGYVDRPRAQLDYYPTSGSAPMVYALADLGAQFLAEGGVEFANLEWSRKNREAGRPFIEHQLEIVDFHVALERSTRGRSDVRLIHPEEIIASAPKATREKRDPFALRVGISHNESSSEIAVIPDLVFGLLFPDGSRRCFMVEIDRGTMPITRADGRQSSFERKMCAYLAAHAEGRQMQQFGWRTFRVLVVTTEQPRTSTMIKTLQRVDAPLSPGPALFLFALSHELRVSDPLAHMWQDGNGRAISIT